MRSIGIITIAALQSVATLCAVFGQHNAPVLLYPEPTAATRDPTGVPSPPEPEPIDIIELPLPPVSASDVTGSCTSTLNPNGTGCISKSRDSFQSGNFLPDGLHVLLTLNYTGAPADPDPASIYSGVQLVLVKINGSTFPNGEPWKCITCGVPAANQVGRNSAMDYPQAFKDGVRVLVGQNIVDCSSFQLASEECTPEIVYIYPLRWNNKANGSGSGGTIRELRLHPDNIHLGFNAFVTVNDALGQYSYFSRLQFNSSPTTGTPLSPRYDLVNATTLANPAYALFNVEGNGTRIRLNPQAIEVGELRGFSGTGKEVTYIGPPVESCNIDVFAVDLTTGDVRRLTSNPEYVDPVDITADDEWTVIEDTRGTNRMMFIAGMRHIPPIIDMISIAAVASVRNNGDRRFFEVWLLDRYGDRGDYNGQKVNAAGDGSSGSVNDPLWNALADPKWSPGGTRIAYTQALTVSPACGGANPLDCPVSTEEGEREYRVMIAHLTSRTPLAVSSVAPVSDTVPWGTPYVAGDTPPTFSFPPQGLYTLAGGATGSADINITWNAANTSIKTVAVVYDGFSYDGDNIISGSEEVTITLPSITLNNLDWFSNLTSVDSDGVVSTKRTSADGFHLTIDLLLNKFEATGTLTTTVNGTVYEKPANGT